MGEQVTTDEVCRTLCLYAVRLERAADELARTRAALDALAAELANLKALAAAREAAGGGG